MPTTALSLLSSYYTTLQLFRCYPHVKNQLYDDIMSAFDGHWMKGFVKKSVKRRQCTKTSSRSILLLQTSILHDNNNNNAHKVIKEKLAAGAEEETLIV